MGAGAWERAEIHVVVDIYKGVRLSPTWMIIAKDTGKHCINHTV